MNQVKVQENAVSEAFSAQSPRFDVITTGNPMEVLFREIVRQHVLQYTQPGEHMLELNCGTGLDAVFFAGHGLNVFATDNASGMLAQLADKVKTLRLEEKISYRRCSFNDLSAIDAGKKFDHVFSNFGGLNCAEDINVAVTQIDGHLKAGSHVHFVLIAPFCWWELMAAFKGRFKYAFRRFHKSGVVSHLEGHYFKTYYYSFRQIKKAFGKNYKMVQLKSLGCFLPPTYKAAFPSRWPVLFGILKKAELALHARWPFNRTGDLYIVTLKRK